MISWRFNSPLALNLIKGTCRGCSRGTDVPTLDKILWFHTMCLYADKTRWSYSALDRRFASSELRYLCLSPQDPYSPFFGDTLQADGDRAVFTDTDRIYHAAIEDIVPLFPPAERVDIRFNTAHDPGSIGDLFAVGFQANLLDRSYRSKRGNKLLRGSLRVFVPFPLPFFASIVSV